MIFSTAVCIVTLLPYTLPAMLQVASVVKQSTCNTLQPDVRLSYIVQAMAKNASYSTHSSEENCLRMTYCAVKLANDIFTSCAWGIRWPCQSHGFVLPHKTLMLTASVMRLQAACVTESIASLIYPGRVIGYIC